MMKLRQAKKILWWSKGDGDYISIHRSKDHRESFWRKMQKLRPAYINEKGVYVQPSMHNIDIIRRANTRLRRWFKKGKHWAYVTDLINEFEEKYNEATN